MTRAELIEKLENATEGSFKLDDAIYEILLSRARTGEPHPPVFRAYTTSIDAALTLVPSGANCFGFDHDPKSTIAYVSRNCVAEGHWLIEGEGKTVPLAIVIAALKAQEKVAEDGK